LGDAIDPIIVYRGVAMNEDVPEGDDFAEIGNAVRDLGFALGKLGERLPDDLNLRSTAERTTSDSE
jgi:hypothetical protein